MAKTVTIGTYNVENLFTRFRFKGKRVQRTVNGQRKTVTVPLDATELRDKAVQKGFILDPKVVQRTMEDTRKLTAKALSAMGADIVGLQEVENLDTLKTFNSRYLKGKKRRFPYQYVIDGNDPRFIDVALLSRYEGDFLRTHQFLGSGRSRTFSRDCLEADFRIGNTTLTVFVNHFKSMMGGRANTKARRLRQANAMIDILKDRFGNNYGDAPFVILGDLNDYSEPGKENESGIQPMLASNQMENVLDRLPAGNRWTHFYNRDKSYHQLDYIFISKALKAQNKTVKPIVERRGMPLRVNPKNGPKRVTKFFPEIKGKLKASDHCAVSIKLRV